MFSFFPGHHENREVLCFMLLFTSNKYRMDENAILSFKHLPGNIFCIISQNCLDKCKIFLLLPPKFKMR